MNENFTAIFIIGIIVLGIYRLFELFVRKNERMTIIDKIGDKIKFSESNSMDLNLPFFGTKSYSSWALRISLLLIGIGLGALVAFFIQYNMMGDLMVRNIEDHQIRNNLEEARGIIYFSCITIFGGIGLLAAYLVELKQQKNALNKG